MNVTTRKAVVALPAIAVLLLGCTATKDITTTPADEPPPASSSAEEEAYNTTPEVDDFEVTLKILSKECYGYGVGCNVEYRAQLGYDATHLPLDPDKTYEITYKVVGGEDGPVIDTIEATGTQYEVPWEEIVGTPSRGTELAAEVIAVEEW